MAKSLSQVIIIITKKKRENFISHLRSDAVCLCAHGKFANFPLNLKWENQLKFFIFFFSKKGTHAIKTIDNSFVFCVPVSFSNVCFHNQMGGAVFFFWTKNRVFFYCSREIFTKDVSVAFTMSLKDPLVFSNAIYSAFRMDVNQTSLLQFFFFGTSHEIYGSTSIIITQKQTRFVDKHNQIKIYNCWLIMIIFL